VGFSTIFIRRPIATSLLMAGLLLLGILGYRKLPVSALPEIDAPSLVVTTQYPGANATTMASLVTTPLERQFGQISGLELMTSDSSAGLSTIILQFSMDRDIDIAAQDVQAAIRQATLPSSLPYQPVYNRVNPADAAIVTLKLTSDTRPLRDVNNYADSILAQRLSQVQGVGLVSIAGNVRSAVRIQVNPAQLSNMGLTLEQLRSALTQANVNAPKGSLNGPTEAAPTPSWPAPPNTATPSSATRTAARYGCRTWPRWWMAWRTTSSPPGPMASRQCCWKCGASPVPTSCRPSSASARSCLNCRACCRQTCTWRSSTTVPRPSAPRCMKCSSP